MFSNITKKFVNEDDNYCSYIEIRKLIVLKRLLLHTKLYIDIIYYIYYKHILNLDYNLLMKNRTFFQIYSDTYIIPQVFIKNILPKIKLKEDNRKNNERLRIRVSRFRSTIK